VPGFEPHGYGAETAGNYRSPLFVERVAEFVAASWPGCSSGA
jgi:hypothetical protein